MIESAFHGFIDNLGILKSLAVPVYDVNDMALYSPISVCDGFFFSIINMKISRAISVLPAAAFRFPRTLCQNSICVGLAFAKLSCLPSPVCQAGIYCIYSQVKLISDFF
jgi:hypothetical protein